MGIAAARAMSGTNESAPRRSPAATSTGRLGSVTAFALGATGDRVEGDEADRRPGGGGPKHRVERALHHARESRDLEPAQHEQMDEAGRDQRVLQLRGNAMVNAQNDAQEHRRVWRGQGGVDGFGVTGTKPSGKSGDTGLVCRDIEAGGL